MTHVPVQSASVSQSEQRLPLNSSSSPLQSALVTQAAPRPPGLNVMPVQSVALQVA